MAHRSFDPARCWRISPANSCYDATNLNRSLDLVWNLDHTKIETPNFSTRRCITLALLYLTAMSLCLRFLGTSAARPTVERNVSSIALIREGEAFLFDCGEGTQRQMMRYGITFNLDDIFFTHFHTDHLLGVVGLLRTMSLQGRTEPLRLWGPAGAERMLKRAESLGSERLAFGLEIRELKPGDAIPRKGYLIHTFLLDHRGPPSIGYALIESERRGRFNPELAAELGIPEGPLWGRIHKGESVTLADGRVIEPSVLVGQTRPGRRVVITGDTRPCAATIVAAEGADLLVHESTFGDEEAARAVETGHSTAREAAQVAKMAGVRQLVLTHVSARYARDAGELELEARSIFPETRVAKDGLEIEVPFRDAEVVTRYA
jgi:ribonuclease Z